MNEEILIVEDRAPIGKLLRSYLNAELVRLVTVAPDLGQSWNPVTEYHFKDLSGELGQGQLRHLSTQPRASRRGDLANQSELRREVEEADVDVSQMPTARLFPIRCLKRLEELASAYEPAGSGYEPDNPDDSRVIALRRYVEDLQDHVEDSAGTPDILIVDLATSDPEVKRMKKVHAYRTPAEFLATPDPDPRPAVRTLTGFKLLRLYSNLGIPVIVTAFWPHPLVVNHCLVNGAQAYVQKPMLTQSVVRVLKGEDEPEQDEGAGRDDEIEYDLKDEEVSWQLFDERAKEGKDPQLVVIQRYLTEVAAEVLKAMTAIDLDGRDPFPDDTLGANVIGLQRQNPPNRS